jgi:leucine dehydrogenase
VIATGLKDRRAAFAYLGRFLNELGPRYCVARDAGSTAEDMAVLNEFCSNVADESDSAAGDLSVATAEGVYHAMRAVAKTLWGSADLKNKRVLIQGLGSIGLALAQRLSSAGARLCGSDVDNARVVMAAERFGLTGVDPDAAASTACDLFAPCALGGVVSEASATTFQCKAIVGAANNIAESQAAVAAVHARGVLLVPDPVTNAGALIKGSLHWLKIPRSEQNPDAKIENIYNTTLEVLRDAEREHITPTEAATRKAAARHRARKDHRHLFFSRTR